MQNSLAHLLDIRIRNINRTFPDGQIDFVAIAIDRRRFVNSDVHTFDIGLNVLELGAGQTLEKQNFVARRKSKTQYL